MSVFLHNACYLKITYQQGKNLKKKIKMIQTVPFGSSSLRSFLEINGVINCSKSSSRSGLIPRIHCSSRNNVYIPKLEPFSRSKLDRAVKEPPLIQKSENQLADYCSTLEGDDSYNCWRAYFELKELQEEASKEEVERLIIEAGGVKSLVGCLHGIAAILKAKKECKEPMKNLTAENTGAVPCPIPDGLPKTFEEKRRKPECRIRLSQDCLEREDDPQLGIQRRLIMRQIDDDDDDDDDDYRLIVIHHPT